MSSKHRSVLEFVSDRWDKYRDSTFLFSNVFINLSIPLLIGRNQRTKTGALGDKFFGQMEAWKTEYPESTLAKVIEKVNHAVTMCQLFLGHVPRNGADSSYSCH